MAKTASAKAPPIAVIYGDEPFQKSNALDALLDALIPPQVDRAAALSIYDGALSPEQGGPSLAGVMDDLRTLPFLSDRRVVVVRDADAFVSQYRENLENYLAAPSPTGVLVLECRSFPKNTRLAKAALSAGGKLCECKKLSAPALIDFVLAEARRLGKQLEPPAAARLVEMIGQSQGALSGEVEKLSLYVGQRASIGERDVSALVGQSREEKIFAVMDAAAAGAGPRALGLWHQTLATDPAAVFKAVGGMAYLIRRWLMAHRLLAEGLPVHAIAPKVNMYGRGRQLEALLRRLPAHRLRNLLAAVSELDSQAKSGTRSIETGIEALLVELAAPAA